MKIGVSGASGHLGRATVAELVQRPGGHEVVAISRTPETVSGPVQRRFGDYNQPESLAEAYADLDRLLIITTVDADRRSAQNVAANDAAVREHQRFGIKQSREQLLCGELHKRCAREPRRS